MGYVRVTLVLNNEEQYNEWKKYQIKNGYSNFSQMIRCTVQKVISENDEPIVKSLKPIKDTINGLYRIVERTNENVEIINMRLVANKEGDSEVIKVASELLILLNKEEKTIAELAGIFTCDKEVIIGAIVLLKDLKLLGRKTAIQN